MINYIIKKLSSLNKISLSYISYQCAIDYLSPSLHIWLKMFLVVLLAYFF